MITILAIIGEFGILVFIHEFGHFVVAKLSGVKVLTFSLGFGPKLIGKQIGETEYRISALPLGGYVRLFGDNPREKVAKKEEKRAFLHQSVPKRMAIIVAGSLANLLLAVFVFSILYLAVGIPQSSPVVGTVMEESPAQKAGMRPGDLILNVNDEKITQWDDLPEAIQTSGGRAIQLTIKRGKEIIAMRVTPQVVTDTSRGAEIRYQIGIAPQIKRDPIHAIGRGFYQTWHLTKSVIVFIAKLIGGSESIKEIGGPILIAKVVGQQAQKGFLNFLVITAIISVNLGIINLFPIPLLDGGHFLFLILEAIRRKPLSVRQMEVVQQIGFIIIILLIVFIFYNDIINHLLPQGAK
jgi:regulator of sigma E protease